MSTQRDELRDFLIILRRALLMVVRWIEKTYEVNDNGNS